MWQFFAIHDNMASTKGAGAKVKCLNCGLEFEIELPPNKIILLKSRESHIYSKNTNKYLHSIRKITIFAA